MNLRMFNGLVCAIDTLCGTLNVHAHETGCIRKWKADDLEYKYIYFECSRVCIRTIGRFTMNHKTIGIREASACVCNKLKNEIFTSNALARA